MEYRPLGRADLQVSANGLGGATFAVLDRALERGITLFDTAEARALALPDDLREELDALSAR